jgi:hypothetical protein
VGLFRKDSEWGNRYTKSTLWRYVLSLEASYLSSKHMALQNDIEQQITINENRTLCKQGISVQ